MQSNYELVQRNGREAHLICPATAIIGLSLFSWALLLGVTDLIVAVMR